jgi:hypothetical protein
MTRVVFIRNKKLYSVLIEKTQQSSTEKIPVKSRFLLLFLQLPSVRADENNISNSTQKI